MNNKEKLLKTLGARHKWALYDLEKDEIIAEETCFMLDTFLYHNRDKIDLKRLDYLFVFLDGEPWGKFEPSYKVRAMD